MASPSKDLKPSTTYFGGITFLQYQVDLFGFFQIKKGYLKMDFQFTVLRARNLRASNISGYSDP